MSLIFRRGSRPSTTFYPTSAHDIIDFSPSLIIYVNVCNIIETNTPAGVTANSDNNSVFTHIYTCYKWARQKTLTRNGSNDTSAYNTRMLRTLSYTDGKQ